MRGVPSDSPGVDLHEGDGKACEEHGDKQEELSAPQVRESADEGSTQEGQQTLPRKSGVNITANMDKKTIYTHDNDEE